MKMKRIAPGVFQAEDEAGTPTYTLYVSQDTDILDADPPVNALTVTVEVE